MSLSDTSEAAILALIFNAQTWANYAINASSSPEATIPVALHTADPGETGTMGTSEIAYTGYARLTGPARTTAALPVTGSNPTSVSPAAAITFVTGAGANATATYFSLGHTGGTAANPILFSGTVTPNIAVTTGVAPQLTTSTAITLD